MSEFENNNILVMTAQIFVDILNHAFFSVSYLNLLILDECHAAVKDSPMKQVLLKLDKSDSKKRFIKFWFYFITNVYLFFKLVAQEF